MSSLARRSYWLTYFLFFIFISGFAVKELWLQVPPSDPLEYIGPVLKGSTIGVWPWLDRIMLGVSLRSLWLLFPGPAADFGASYALTVTLATIAVAVFYLHRRFSEPAALTFLTLSLSSYYVSFFTTQVFPEPTLVFFAMVSALLFFESLREEVPTNSMCLFLSGVFAGFTSTCKITGIALPLTLIGVLLIQRRFKTLFYLAAGILTGFTLAALAFALLFGWSGLQDTWASFFATSVQQNMRGRAEYNNAVTFWDVFFDKVHYPVFVAAIVFSGTWLVQKNTKLFTYIAWSFFFTLYGLYLISGRGYIPIANYIYPAYAFFMLAFASSINRSLQISRALWQLAFVAALLILWLLSLRTTMDFDPTLLFKVSFPLQVSFHIRFFAVAAALLVIGATIAIRFYPSQRNWVWFLMAVVIWGGAFGAGSARHLFVRILKPDTNMYHDYGKALGQVQSPTGFQVFIPQWNEQADPIRLRDIYWTFYSQPAFSKTNFNLIKSDELKSAAGPLLTTELTKVQEIWKKYETLQQFVLHGVQYFVVRPSLKP